MAVERFDALVIGAGQAGPSVAARCGEAGMRVALVERQHLGGTCVNTGCYPTKTLVASARALHLARRGAEFGFEAAGVRVDMRRVKQRKDEIVSATRANVEAWVSGMKGVEWIRGHARFVAPRTVRVGERTLTAEHVFLNVGARATRPALDGIDSVPTLDNVSVLDLEEVPSHLVIVGAGYIGLEFAQVMRRFGSDVTVVERSNRLLPREDDDIATEVRSVLEDEGIRFRLGAECMALERGPHGSVRMRVDCVDDQPFVEGSHVLLAVGRTPNTDDLGLEAAGIRANAFGHVEVDDQCRTSAEGVWAMGDCNGRGAFTHTAWNDHEIVVDRLFGKRSLGIGQRIPCYGMFIDPPLGRVGMTEREVRATGRPALVATMPMRRVGRAREAGETRGMMKALIDVQTQRILGAAIFGLNGDEAIHGLLWAMSASLPYTALAQSVPIHPTVSELIPTLLQQAKPL
ncbi:MAG: FAD-containing oxidoreductase [Burkholderiaceae bacterium]|nr:FAD-containing oxidoreductase [Burkholderiaceae bacterium]